MKSIARTALLLILAVPLSAPADGTEDELIRAADQAREAADMAEAALLAPGSYGQGIGALERARRDYRGGATLEAVQVLADAAQAHLIAAAATAQQAQLTLQPALARREAARQAEAFRLAAPTWIKAEELLRSAARQLEKTDVAGALKRSAKAGELYDQAELLAIKVALLTAARSRVVGLDAAGTARLAPMTTAAARQLLQQAEQELDTDRTRTAAATALAADAVAEADHAVALSHWLAEAKTQDRSTEDIVREWESSLIRTAQAAGTRVDLAAGPVAAGTAVAKAVGDLRQGTEQQAEELRQRERQIGALEEEIRDLDGQLSGATRTTHSLTQQLEARERARQRLEQLEALFTRDQANVVRQGDNIIVRVQGLAFAPGSAKLPPAAAALLGKLRDAVALYPRAPCTVEGHTDSTGDSAANHRLSQARANAVREYLVDKLQVPAGRLTAIGYGDSRPLASNETNEGRRQNRRIDLVITPRDPVSP